MLTVPQPVEFLAAGRRAVPCGDDEYSGHVRPPANGVDLLGITSPEIAKRQSDGQQFFRQPVAVAAMKMAEVRFNQPLRPML